MKNLLVDRSEPRTAQTSHENSKLSSVEELDNALLNVEFGRKFPGAQELASNGTRNQQAPSSEEDEQGKRYPLKKSTKALELDYIAAAHLPVRLSAMLHAPMMLLRQAPVLEMRPRLVHLRAALMALRRVNHITHLGERRQRARLHCGFKLWRHILVRIDFGKLGIGVLGDSRCAGDGTAAGPQDGHTAKDPAHAHDRALKPIWLRVALVKRVQDDSGPEKNKRVSDFSHVINKQ